MTNAMSASGREEKQGEMLGGRNFLMLGYSRESEIERKGRRRKVELTNREHTWSVFGENT